MSTATDNLKSDCLTYATVCSGIECMSVACRGLPLRPVFFSEIEPFPCAVLKAHYPDVPNLGDMSKISVTNKTEITNGTIRLVLERPLDILAGGTPCQDVSVAGKRAGMQEGSGTRSSLAFDFVRLARELGPRYILWENVAGAIDSKNAPDFLAFLRALGDCGYSLAWRVLDAQYVRVDGMERAVPQRRRRVWVVGCLGADESLAGKILFEPDCVAGHTAPRRRAGEGFAYSLAGRDSVHARMVEGAPGAVGFEPGIARREGGANRFTVETASTLRSHMGDNQPSAAIALEGNGQRPSHKGTGINDSGASFTLNHVEQHGVAYAAKVQLFETSHADEVVRMAREDCAPTVQNREYKGGMSVVQCYENHAQDSRVQGPIDTAPTQGSSNANSAGVSGNNPLVIFSKVSHPTAPNGEGERWDEREVAQTRNTFDNGEKRCQEVVVSMAQNTRDEVRIIGGDGQIAGALPAEPGMKQQTYVAIAREGAEGE